MIEEVGSRYRETVMTVILREKDPKRTLADQEVIPDGDLGIRI